MQPTRPILSAFAAVLLSAATSVAIAQSALPWAVSPANPAGPDASNPGESLASDTASPTVRAAVVYPDPDELQIPAGPVSRQAYPPIQEQPVVAADPTVTPTAATEPAGSPEPTAAPAVASAIPSHPITDPVFYPDPDNFQEQGGMFGLMMYQERATQPGVVAPRNFPEPPGALFEGGNTAGGENPFARYETPAPGAEGTTKTEISTLASVDTGSMLQASPSVDTVKVQRRSPISQDPHIRGYKYAQIYTLADGVYWTPARLDLDTMLSKIDPNMIQDVGVIPGPYGLRYGPGFAFIDVTRAPTPRSASGIVQDFDTTFDTRTNGGQINFRETVSGGGEDWGYRFSYGDRKGSDYRAGNDLKIPSSYQAQDLWGQLSYDINPHQRLDFAFQRLDQTDTEYPAQFFDLNFLGTYGFQAALIDDAPYGPWNRLSVETWYNRTWFDGNADQKAARSDFPVMQRVNWALTDYYHQSTSVTKATTLGSAYSSGARSMATFGDAREDHVNLGADFRYLGQRIGEHFDTNAPVQDPNFDTNMPHAWLMNPGMFAEWSAPVNDAWTVSLGARTDFVRTAARAEDLIPGSYLDSHYRDMLTQNDILYSFYLTNNIEMDEFWTLTGGFGYGQRPPSLVERYADGLFLSLAQSGFERFIGNPELDYERNWQIDLGVTGEFDRVRVRANAFQAWIIDYVTWQDHVVSDFPDAKLLQFVNTPLATLAGFELSGEYDLSPTVTSFAEMAYVDGRDRAIHQPLPAISPLDNRLGLRWHDPQKGRRWGVELAARLALYQDRLGTIRQGDTGLVSVESFTPGFSVWDLRTYWNYTDKMRFIAGIDNLFDETYQEHLDLRLRGPSNYPGQDWTRVYEPGITPYFGVNWIF